ncbi:MAG: beta-ketoacyl-[acyl-carrier-protein] synthase II, partial [Phototrophicales bacterium]
MGASEAAVCELGVAGFCALKALSKIEDPKIASMPFDQARAGFVIAEGAAMLVLEEKEHAMKRGAKIYANYLGAGIANDAYHVTAPAPDGRAAIAAMNEAMQMAQLKSSDVGYISAHATSTKIGDSIELLAVKKLFAQQWDELAVSSIKGAIGHALGAAGAIEAVMAVLSLYHQKILPTINLSNVDEEAFLDGKCLNLV